MDFSLAYVKSKKQFILKDFTSSASTVRDKQIEWKEIADHPVQAIIFSNELSSDEEFMHEIERERHYLAVRSNADLQISFEQFQNLEHPQAQNLLQLIQRGEVLKSNLSLLEEFFVVLKHLKELYPDDRMSFFEELWFILKNNLGAKNLKLVYNDIADKEKNTLIQVLVEGERHPHSVSGSKFAKTLMKEYQKHISSHFEIVEYEKEQYQLSAVAHIDKSPIIFMAQVFSVSRLQKALLKSLFHGLQRDIIPPA